MKILQFENTFATLRQIKADLVRARKAISYTSMALFAFYYIYLIIINFEMPFYSVIYSILFLTILSLFIVEVSFKGHKIVSKKERRVAIERKRRYKALIKFCKYSAKATLLVFAIYEMIKNLDFAFSNIINIGLLIFLIIQIIFEIVVYYVIKQIDYIKYSFEIDMEKSFLAKTVKSISKPKKSIGKTLKRAASSIKGEKELTKQEDLMLEEINERTEKYKAEKEKRKTEQKKAENLEIKEGFRAMIEAVGQKNQNNENSESR